MNAIQHALLARALIDANGGVDACCKPVTRVERSQLYAYRDPNAGAFMPADIIDTLERRCGNPVYSAFLYNQISVEPPTEDVLQEAADVDEAGNDVWRFIRRKLGEGGTLSENDRREAERLLKHAEVQTAELRAVINKDRTS
jgi:hypothetical protein